MGIQVAITANISNMNRSDLLILILSGVAVICLFWRIQYERKLENQNAYLRELVEECKVKPKAVLI